MLRTCRRIVGQSGEEGVEECFEGAGLTRKPLNEVESTTRNCNRLFIQFNQGNHIAGTY